MCSNTQYRCGPSDDRCIPRLWKCDGEKDCRDGSDEPDNCPVSSCPHGQFQCKNGNCTFSFRVCDLVDDCGDGSDEDGCHRWRCEPWQQKCQNGKCIPKAWNCDGHDDCGDASDERGCGNKTCKPGQFQCDNGNCIQANWKCDFDDDCGDNSDEKEEFNCAAQECEVGWWRCATNYRCVPNWARCDGEDDCRDNSDEREESCPVCHSTGDFRCQNRRCIPKRWMCDFDDDCGDNSDEDPGKCEGSHRKCSESEFRCSNNKCVQGRFKCDHDDDCGDASDERPELCRDYRKCEADQYRCSSGHCTHLATKCDGYRDCLDASDETSCADRYPGEHHCKTSEFQCSNHMCIPQVWRCDGADDCGDESDESPEVCKEVTCSGPARFLCDNFKCIPAWRRCDGVDNCGDGSDEERCEYPPTVCESDQFKCTDGTCIDGLSVCDLSPDCADMSDEIGCHKNNGLTCATNNGGCEHNCTDLGQGSYYCSCNHGLKVNPDKPKECLDIDECSRWGNNCPQDCINVKGSFKCRCHDGFSDSNNRGHNCKAEGEKMVILFTVGNEVRRYKPKSKDYTTEIVSGVRTAGIDVDPDRRLVYWSDTSLGRLYRAAVPSDDKKKATAQNLEVARVYKPEGISLDWVAKNIYWTDSQARTISVANADGFYTKVLIDTDLIRPTSIAVHPGLGLMFWTDTGVERPRIERAWLSGSRRRVLVSTRLGVPSGIAVDHYMGGRVYWCDSKENIIESMKVDGSDRVVVTASSVFNPVSIDLFEGSMYWLSQSLGRLASMDKFGREQNKTLQTGLQVPRALKIFHIHRYNISIKSTCQSLGCSHLCLLIPFGAQCACPTGIGFVPGTGNTVCDTAHPKPARPLPKEICQCRNRGVCRKEENSLSFVCICPKGFYGELCESREPPSTVKPDSPDQGKIQQEETSAASLDPVAIAVPIAVVLILIIVIVVVIVILKRRGVDFNFRRFSSRRAPSSPTVSFQGDGKVRLGVPDRPFDDPGYSGGQQTNSDDRPSNFSNPVYDSLHGITSGSQSVTLHGLDTGPHSESSTDPELGETTPTSQRPPTVPPRGEHSVHFRRAQRAFDPNTDDDERDVAGLVQPSTL